MPKFVFEEDAIIALQGVTKDAPADPEVIGAALEEIREGAGGELKPKAVVDAARSPVHPLHRHFEWRDAVAAESYRLDQARALIRVVRIVDTDMTRGTVRAFVSIADRGGASYRSIEQIRRSADLQRIVLDAAERDLMAFERRYDDFLEIAELIRTARERVRDRQAALKTAVEGNVAHH